LRLNTASWAVTGLPSQNFAFALSVKSNSVADGLVYVAIPFLMLRSGCCWSRESHRTSSAVFYG